MPKVYAPAVTASGARVYRAADWGGWVTLTLLAALYIGAGVFIRAALIPAHPIWGAIAVISGSVIALVWVAIYYSFRVSTHAIVAPEGFTLVHGPWRHFIAWNDVARVAEFSAVHDSLRYNWLALWSLNGLRLQAREDMVPDFPAFRQDVLGELDIPHVTPAIVKDLSHPLVVASDRSPAVPLWGMGMLLGIIGGALLLIFLPEVWLVGAGVVAFGVVCLGVALGQQFFRQEVMIGNDGVRSRRGWFTSEITWAAMYGMDRDPGNGLRGAVGILLRGLVMIMFRIDRRSAVVPGEERSHAVITIRGNSGERIRIREENYRHPEWLRARLRAEVNALRQAAAPLAARVTPLPPTGPLSPGIELPPDPLESSTLWLRESGETDMLRDQIAR